MSHFLKTAYVTKFPCNLVQFQIHDNFVRWKHNLGVVVILEDIIEGREPILLPTLEKDYLHNLKHYQMEASQPCCPRHPDTIVEVQQPDEFSKFSPKGRCRDACADRLGCGHRFQRRCHPATMHSAFQCEKPCGYLHQPCNHLCQKPTYGEVPGKCMVLLDAVSLPCRHFKGKSSLPLSSALGYGPVHSTNFKAFSRVRTRRLVRCSLSIASEKFKCPSACTTPLPVQGRGSLHRHLANLLMVMR